MTPETEREKAVLAHVHAVSDTVTTAAFLTYVMAKQGLTKKQAVKECALWTIATHRQMYPEDFE